MSRSRGIPLALSRADVDRWRSRLVLTASCAVWVGAVGSDGYGRFTYRHKGRQRTVTPHLVAAELAGGALEPGETILHDCDVRVCCCADRAGHVRVATQRENMRQAVARGRARGPYPGAVDVRGPVGQSRAIQKAVRASADHDPVGLALVVAAAVAAGDPLRDHPVLFDLAALGVGRVGGG